MDYLWTPWRYAYISGEARTPGCLFCQKAAEPDDEKALIVHRGQHCYIILNAFPFTNGHIMVVPYAHLDELRKLPAEHAAEMMALARQAEDVLRKVYQPDGLNLGMNLGKAAGAGVADHLHLHVLPRWVGDTNFLTTVAETRAMPETLDTTYRKLKGKFQREATGGGKAPRVK